MSTAPSSHDDGLYPKTVRSEIAKPRRETDARRRAGQRRTGEVRWGTKRRARRPGHARQWPGLSQQRICDYSRTASPHDSWRFVAKACRRDARRALGGVKPWGILAQYVDGLNGETARRSRVFALAAETSW